MKYILQIVVLTLSLVCGQNTQNLVEKAGPNLVTVVMVFRHGDRTPIKPYPNDPYKNTSYWPVGWGQLTNTGKEQHYELGKWFRQRYINFLPEQYSERDVFVRSTDVDRTLMSAEANLAGLFIPKGRQVWNPTLSWQPIPIHTKPEKEDAILAMKRPCPKYDALYEELKRSPDIAAVNQKNKELYKYLTKMTGRKIKNMQDLEFIYSVLNIENIYNYTLPDWTKGVFPEKMRDTASLSFALPCFTKDLARLKVGPFMAEMLDHLYNTTATMKHKYNRKLWMYSAHDTTVANILNGLDLFEYHTPPYTSTILFELYTEGTDKDFYVNILYKNSSVPQKLTLPGCEFNCPLEEFTQIVADITLSRDNYDEACKLSVFEYLPFTSNFQGVFVITMLGCLVIVLMVILVGVLCVKRQQERRAQLAYFRIPDRDI